MNKLETKEIIRKIFDYIDMDDVKLVEFCWYNGCDAPDYYDITQDKFYDPV